MRKTFNERGFYFFNNKKMFKDNKRNYLILLVDPEKNYEVNTEGMVVVYATAKQTENVARSLVEGTEKVYHILEFVATSDPTIDVDEPLNLYD